MSGTGKRIPKRSILGSRVSAKGQDGWWKIGVVVAMKTDESFLRMSTTDQRFSVKMEGEKIVREYRESDLVGPGFQSNIPNLQCLEAGQGVYITHGGREVGGVVIKHDLDEDQVVVAVVGVGKVDKRLEEVRLLESRKSSRLVNNDTDFSRLADFNIVEQRKKLTELPESRRRLHSASEIELARRRRASETDRRKAEAKEERRRQRSERITQGEHRRVSTGSASIDVPNILSGSRKRRTSERSVEVESGYSSSHSSARSWAGAGEEKITECTAAMVLMRLSASPKERGLWRDSPFSPDESSSGSSSVQCPASPASPPTPAPSPTISLPPLDDEEEPAKRSKASHVVFQCTWRGCDQREDSQDQMERHVRGHLGRPEPGPDTIPDYEEEFYYTELDMDEDILGLGFMQAIPEQPSAPPHQAWSPPQASPAEEVLPRKEANTSPGLLSTSCPASSYTSSSLGDHLDMARPAHEAPTIIFVNNINAAAAANKPGTKFIQIYPRPSVGGGSPEGKGAGGGQQSVVFKTGTGRSVLRTEKKCRKVYGIEKRELWCTQCKWKKACARFQEA